MLTVKRPTIQLTLDFESVLCRQEGVGMANQPVQLLFVLRLINPLYHISANCQHQLKEFSEFFKIDVSPCVVGTYDSAGRAFQLQLQ